MIVQLVVTLNIDIVIIFNFSWACAIDLQDRVVVTGDNEDRSRVQVYNISGPQEQLPSLQTPRSYHACAHYMDSQDRVVSIACNITAHLTIVTLHCVVMIIILMFRFCW